jgi:hypothetical protein
MKIGYYNGNSVFIFSASLTITKQYNRSLANMLSYIVFKALNEL